MKPDRYPENSPGDFYVQNGACTACGAPQAEAPDLIEHSLVEYGHCYFKKQPCTEQEIERAINAIAVSCVSGLRYGGTNETILKWLYEIGEGEQCDHKPVGNYQTLIYGKVTFEFTGSIHEVYDLVSTQLLSRPTHYTKEIVNFKLWKDEYFEFVYRRANGAAGNVFKCSYLGESRFGIEIQVEKKELEISIRGNSLLLNSILQLDERISRILWFDRQNNNYSDTEIR